MNHMKNEKISALKATFVMFLTFMVLFVMPVRIFADESADHSTHSGYRSLSMGMQYIKVDDVEQTNNNLDSGNYYLTGDITVTLNIEGNVNLCLNGFSVNSTDNYGILLDTDYSEIIIDDCRNTGKITGITTPINIGGNGESCIVTINGGIIEGTGISGIRTSGYDGEININGGSIIGNNYGIYATGTSRININGGSITGTEKYGLYNGDDTVVSLSGNPEVSGGMVDIYNGIIYADSVVEPRIPYSGSIITYSDTEKDYHDHDDIIVLNVTEANKGLFALSDDFTKFSLRYDSERNMLRTDGEILSVTWYDEDGVTVLSGTNHPSEVHYGECLSVMPGYESEEKILIGWYYRQTGTDEWSTETYYIGNKLRYSLDFKAKTISKYLFEGDGTVNAPFLIQNIDDLVKLQEVVNENYKYYNSNTVYYKLMADIDLSSVCGEDKGNWTPIGKNGFSAQFDGNGHKISNLYCVLKANNIGLFATLNSNSSIKNLTVTGYVSGTDYFNGVVGNTKNGTVSNCLDLTRRVPYGYISDEYGWMTYKGYADASVDIKAFYRNNWIKTSYSSSEQYKIKTEGLNNVSITVTPTIINGGSYVKVAYTLTNDGDTAVTGGKLAVHSDIQIGDNDRAAIELIKDKNGNYVGFKMIDNHTSECVSKDARLNLYFAGVGGVVDADTYWFGYYGDRQDAAFKTISQDTVNSSRESNYEKDEDGNYIKLNDTDSGIAFSWQNIELAAGETKEYSWVINVSLDANPPQWGNPDVRLYVADNGEEDNSEINVVASVNDEEEVIDRLYYSVDGGPIVFVGGVITDGENDKKITGIIDTDGWADGNYNIDFWVVNNLGSVSENVRKNVKIVDGKIVIDENVSFVEQESSHNWSTDWTYDESHHWHDCINENCTFLDNDQKDGYGAHTFDSDCDTTCNDCGFTRTITHIFNQRVMTDRYLVSPGTCTERAKYYYSCTCGEAGTTTFDGEYGEHVYRYSAENGVITETCVGGCGHSESAALIAPSDLIYDGTQKYASVSYSDGWQGGELDLEYNRSECINVGTVIVSIVKDDETAVLSYNIIARDASVTAPVAKENLVYDGNAKKLIDAGSSTGGSMQYAVGSSAATAPESGWSTDIPESRNAGTYYVWYKVDGGTNYNDVAPACIPVTIARAEITVSADNKTKTYGESDPQFTWNVTGGTVILNDNIEGITVSRVSGEDVGDYAIELSQTEGSNPNYNITLEDGMLTIVQKEIGISWGNKNLMYNGAEQKPAANPTGIAYGDDITLTVNGGKTNVSDTAYTATVSGIVGTKSGNYKLPENITTEFFIIKAYAGAPAGIGKTDETISKKGDGTITGVTSAMEYRKDGQETYTDIDGSSIGNLDTGKYYVRLKGDQNYNPSAETEIIIEAGRKLKITVPKQQIGYTLESTEYETDYLGAVTLTFNLEEGYSRTQDFAISIGDDKSAVWQNNRLLLDNINNDINIAVDGVADITAPIAEIKVKDNRWNSFKEAAVLVRFAAADAMSIVFNEAQSVSIMAEDAGSGVDIIQYYVADAYLDYETVKLIVDWENYSKPFELKPDNSYVVYAKIADKAGNTLYIGTDELIFDASAPVLDGIENNGTYYGDKTIQVYDEQTGLAAFMVDGVDVTDKINNNTYTIAADNEEHIIVAIDNAGNAAEYKISLQKKYTITYEIDGETISTEIVWQGKDTNFPEIPAKSGYTAEWVTVIDEATNSIIAKVVYTRIDTPPTSDETDIWMWIAILLVSGAAVITLNFSGKRKTQEN